MGIRISKKLKCRVCEDIYIPICYNQRYCSAICKSKAQTKRRRQHITAHCRGCGITFHPKTCDRISYCSRECYFVARGRVSEERKCLKTIAENWREPITIECPGCHTLFFPNINQQYCSTECEKTVTKARRQVAYVNRISRCLICGRQFEWEKHALKNRCPQCNKEIQHAIKKAILKRHKIIKRYGIKKSQTELIRGVDIFIRDNWQCQMCGRKVTEKDNVNNDDYAHLDHIIPLSKGGTHTLDNVQALCRKCNLIKSDNIYCNG